MTPNSFEFSLTMPGDSRLVGAIRGLTAHAAGYVHLAREIADGLADEVARATEAAIASTDTQSAPIDVRFAGNDAAVLITISCPARGSTPISSSADGVSVEWTSDGRRHTCQIRQPLTD